MERLAQSVWAKAAILCLALLLAAASLVDSLASNWRLTRPDDVLRVRPGDGLALALAEDLHIAGVVLTPDSAVAMTEHARAALRAEPLNPIALRQLGAAEAMANHPARALQLVQLAHRVSRRELGTLIWLIDHSIAQGDDQAMLARFDEALSTNEMAAEMLFPALASAIGDAELRSGVARHLAAHRPWMPDFLRYALADGEGRAYVGMLVQAAGGLPRIADYDGIDGAILASMARDGDFAGARTYLASMPGGSALLRDAGISVATTGDEYGPFAWQLSAQEGLESYMRDGGGLSIRVARDQQGVAARRILLLPAGRYMLRARFEAPAGAAAGTRWDIMCAGRGGERVWSEDVPATQPRPLLARFVIPNGCAAQELFLSVVGDSDSDSDSDSESDGEVEISAIVVQGNDGRPGPGPAARTGAPDVEGRE